MKEPLRDLNIMVICWLQNIIAYMILIIAYKDLSSMNHPQITGSTNQSENIPERSNMFNHDSKCCYFSCCA